MAHPSRSLPRGPSRWPDWRLPDLRRILLHAITEIACHAGHLDAVRELIHGTTWLGETPCGMTARATIGVVKV